MNTVTRLALAATLLAATAAATAQAIPGLGRTCTPSAGTFNIPAPGSGSFTVGPLAAYGNLPSQTCVDFSVAPTFTTLTMSIQSTDATTYNNATYSACGTTIRMNGGPVYSASVGQGSFALGTSAPTGSFEATGYTRVDNLTVTVGGQAFNISAPLQQFRTRVTLNADGTQDVLVCTGAGVNTSINGAAQALPANIWQCLQPGAGGAVPNTVRVRYEAC